MQIQEHISLKARTTMHIGGTARYFVTVRGKKDLEEATTFARKRNLPLIVLGSGSNTVFADGTIEAVVMVIDASTAMISGTTVTVQAGKSLPKLVAELARGGLDLSVLAGIPGTVGGAIFGNAGQGPEGKWMDSFVTSVTAFVDGEWKSFSKAECLFSYRESIFKKLPSPIIWEAVLTVPLRSPEEIQADIAHTLKRRAETQIAARTAGSCFKAWQGTPAWRLIDAAGLKGFAVGDVSVSDKHANFLVNNGEGTFIDLVTLIDTVRTKTGKPLEIEMRLFDEEGQVIG